MLASSILLSGFTVMCLTLVYLNDFREPLLL
uniref:Uncharacterized protein n=1 Tax=Rhizophora mucronata TaxID=61149 RepID=A0A2P2Q1D8_RHIMU